VGGGEAVSESNGELETVFGGHYTSNILTLLHGSA
jgi:hypothetical protein